MKAVVFYEHNTDKSMDEFMEVFPRHEAFENEFLKSLLKVSKLRKLAK